jgi:hypothetical protein
METKFDDKARVENAAKELIRAVVYENTVWGGGEHENVLDKVIDDCLKRFGNTLIENALIVAHNTYLKSYIERESKIPDWSDKLNAIIQAAKNHQFTDEIDEIDMLSYTEPNMEKQKDDVFEDRFDYIDTATFPFSVHFICGTGHPDRNIALGRLTEESINKLYACIDKEYLFTL